MMVIVMIIIWQLSKLEIFHIWEKLMIIKKWKIEYMPKLRYLNKEIIFNR